MGDLHDRVWFDIVKTLAVDQLVGTSYIDRFIRGIFPTGWKIVPIHFSPVAILTALQGVMSLLEEDIRNDTMS